MNKYIRSFLEFILSGLGICTVVFYSGQHLVRFGNIEVLGVSVQIGYVIAFFMAFGVYTSTKKVMQYKKLSGFLQVVTFSVVLSVFMGASIFTTYQTMKVADLQSVTTKNRTIIDRINEDYKKAENKRYQTFLDRRSTGKAVKFKQAAESLHLLIEQQNEAVKSARRSYNLWDYKLRSGSKQADSTRKEKKNAYVLLQSESDKLQALIEKQRISKNGEISASEDYVPGTKLEPVLIKADEGVLVYAALIDLYLILVACVFSLDKNPKIAEYRCFSR